MPRPPTPRRTWLAPLVLVALAAAGPGGRQEPKPANTAIDPRAPAGRLGQAARGVPGAGQARGTSTSSSWATRSPPAGTAGRPIWSRYYAPARRPTSGSAATGPSTSSGGSTTARSTRSSPKVVVLMIGTNNLRPQHRGPGRRGGHGRRRPSSGPSSPRSKILLLGRLPPGGQPRQDQAADRPRAPGRPDQRADRQARRRQDRQVPRHRRRLPRRGRPDPPGDHARLPPPQPQGLPDLGRRHRADPLGDDG